MLELEVVVFSQSSSCLLTMSPSRTVCCQYWLEIRKLRLTRHRLSDDMSY